MKLIKYIFTIIILALSSCSEPKQPNFDRIDELEIGMSTQEVIGIIGDPRLKTIVDKKKTVFYYDHPTDDSKNIYMIFVQDSLLLTPQVNNKNNDTNNKK